MSEGRLGSKEGRLLVKPAPSLEEVLREPPSMEITLEEFHRFRRGLSEKAEL